MSINDADALILLKEYEKREKLRKILTEPYYVYYFHNARQTFMSILSIIFTLAVVVFFPLPYALFTMFIFDLMIRVSRQEAKINALIELMEMEKEKSGADSKVSISNQTPDKFS